jgi:hypothetical protein
MKAKHQRLILALVIALVAIIAAGLLAASAAEGTRPPISMCRTT